MRDLAAVRERGTPPCGNQTSSGGSSPFADDSDAEKGRPPCGANPSYLRLTLLGSFTLLRGDAEIPLSRASERLLALLAVRGGAARRGALAGTLWSDADEPRAYASLRSALSRLNRIGHQLIESRSDVLRLTDHVGVDFLEAREMARRIVEGEFRDSDVAVANVAKFCLDFLPDWYDDWVILEAEDWRQLRLHALEALSVIFTCRGRFPDAVTAAISAVKGDQLRESARQTLVKAHLAENNPSEAIREFERYRRLIHEELGLEPSPDFVRLMKSAKS